MRRFDALSAMLGALFLALFLALPGLGGPGLGGGARAAAGPWVDQEQVRLRLVAAGPVAGAAETLNLGLHFRLEPGWKIYWRSPGEAGYPPSVDWRGSENLAEVRLNWPVPHRFSLFGFETFGYYDEVVLPVDARPERPGAPVLLRAKVAYLTCKEICIPREAQLVLAVPAGGAGSSSDGFLIDSFRTMVPGDGTAVGLSLDRAVLTGTVEAPVLQVTARSDIAFDAPDVLVEAPPGFAFGKPEVALTEDGKTAALRLAVVAAPDESVLEGKRLTLTVIDGRRGMEQEVIARFARPATAEGAAAGSLAAILGLALLGGLILNLMPCVLPVLSIKLLSVVNHGGRDRGAVRASFLASAAGIVASFLVLAGVAVALKGLGMTVGWGIQFQQPLFLTAMAVVISLFACNLFGFFEILLPRWAQGLAGLGRQSAPDAPAHGLAGHFLTGAFATLLATPCSAPFLGTAVGFALARGPGEILLIFATLGLGLALPYLGVAAAPALATRLPRPGHWMVTLRRILGLALAATALWLLSVLAAQVGFAPTLGVGALLLALGIVLWLGHARRAGRVPVPALAGALAVAAFVLPTALPTQDAAAVAVAPAATDEAWREMDIGLIPALVAEGKTVFVDVTADWCLTCQVNKKLVLDTDEVRARLQSDAVVAMRGDWTLPSEEISRYLESFGRYGIPFDAVYGPGLPDGLALPELLTKDAVREAIARAAGG
ncbi:MAG: thioredoxin family protein [Proteobacteria bacterium]|nr:thioredoxin family protein [Pseudomonadota bacterium]